MYVSKRVMRKGRERSLIQAPPPPKTKKEAKEGEDVPELSNETKWGKKYSRGRKIGEIFQSEELNSKPAISCTSRGQTLLPSSISCPLSSTEMGLYMIWW